MRVEMAWPPNIEAIREVFPIEGHEVFCYGDVIYSPSGIHLPTELLAHEAVHARQQAAHPGGVKGWWAEYLIDPPFRLEQELEAHAEEYRTFCRHVKDRNQRARMLHRISCRLASPQYKLRISPIWIATEIRKRALA